MTGISAYATEILLAGMNVILSYVAIQIRKVGPMWQTLYGVEGNEDANGLVEKVEDHRGRIQRNRDALIQGGLFFRGGEEPDPDPRSTERKSD